MSSERIFPSEAFFQPTDSEPIRSVVTVSPEAAVIAWYVKPGQRLAPHIHPTGQDTWMIQSGECTYILDAAGHTRTIRAGDVVIAPAGSVHGAINDGAEPLRFISVVSPAESGFELV
jgi:quercetin dioxygenase-like cupin family protein